MYIPKHNREEDTAKLCAFMKEYSFATLVTARDDLPRATHLPFLVEALDDSVTLTAHMAKANGQWRDLSGTGESEALVIFQEPHAYVSPRHYENPLSVPTWNYVAVHAYGRARILDSTGEKLQLLERMIRSLDTGYLEQWGKLPEDYKHEKLNGIVAFAIDVRRLQGRFKLSQDRTEAECENIIREFDGSPNSAKSRIGELMRETLRKP